MTYSVDEKGKETVTTEAPDLVCAGCHSPITGAYSTFASLHWHKQCHPLKASVVERVTENGLVSVTLPIAEPELKARTFVPLDTSILGRKDDSDKPRWDLLPWGPLSEVVGVLTYGAKKYAPDNWKHVSNPRSRYFSAALRHVVAWQTGELIDPESGHHHLAHAICCLLFCIWVDRTTTLR